MSQQILRIIIRGRITNDLQNEPNLNLYVDTEALAHCTK